MSGPYEAIDTMQVGTEMDKKLAAALGWRGLVDWGSMGIRGQPPEWCAHLYDRENGLATLPPLSTVSTTFNQLVLWPLLSHLAYHSAISQYRRDENEPFDLERAGPVLMRTSVTVVFTKEMGGGAGQAFGFGYVEACCKALLKALDKNIIGQIEQAMEGQEDNAAGPS